MMKFRKLLGLLFILLLVGCGSAKPDIFQIEAAEVEKIQISLGMNTGVVPDPLERDDPEDEKVIRQVIDGYKAAEYQGEVGPHDTMPMTSMPIGTSLIIFLDNGEEVHVRGGTQSLIVLDKDLKERGKIYNEDLMRWMESRWDEEFGR